MVHLNKVGSFEEFRENSVSSWLVHTDVPFKSPYVTDELLESSWNYAKNNEGDFYEFVRKFAKIHYSPSLEIELGAVKQILEVGDLIPEFIKKKTNLEEKYIRAVHHILSATGKVQITSDINIDYIKNSSGWDKVNPLHLDDVFHLSVKQAFQFTKVSSCNQRSIEAGLWKSYCHIGKHGIFEVEFIGKADNSHKHSVIYLDFSSNTLKLVTARDGLEWKSNKSVIEMPLVKPAKPYYIKERLL